MKHLNCRDLKIYLKSKDRFKTDNGIISIKSHLDSCRTCWKKWNRFRWDLSKDSQGFKELQEYLGRSFRWYFDASWALAEEWKRKNPKSFIEIEKFYKHSKNYLYSLTLWHESGDRKSYLEDFVRLDKKINIDSCLDYGCGIGSDGLRMLDLGKKVYFYDFDNPSIRFLRWRLKKRNKKAVTLCVGKTKRFPRVDLIWVVDVLEHMVDPTEALDAISNKTKVFVHVSQFGEKRGGRHPFHFEFNTRILNRALLRKKFILSDESFSNLNVWIKR